MVYVSQGNVLQNRSPWSLSFISDAFWGFIEIVSLFFRTLVQPDLTKHGRPSAGRGGSGNGRGPPPYPGRRFGGFGPSSDSPSAPPMGGG